MPLHVLLLIFVTLQQSTVKLSLLVTHQHTPTMFSLRPFLAPHTTSNLPNQSRSQSFCSESSSVNLGFVICLACPGLVLPEPEPRLAYKWARSTVHISLNTLNEILAQSKLFKKKKFAFITTLGMCRKNN